MQLPSKHEKQFRNATNQRLNDRNCKLQTASAEKEKDTHADADTRS